MEMLVLLLAIAMVVPLPFEEIVGGYVRLLLVPIEDAHNHRRFLRMEVVQPLLLQGVKLAFPCCCLLKIRAYFTPLRSPLAIRDQPPSVWRPCHPGYSAASSRVTRGRQALARPGANRRPR